MESFLTQASIYLAAAVIMVPLAKRLGMGSVLGYLVAGMLIGPAFGLVGAETRDLQHFAEFGIVMMLFVVGLELDPRALWDMRHRLFGLGGLQIGLTTALIALIAKLAGQSIEIGIVIGMIFALSSTAIVLQTLSEKGLMHVPGGRSAFSVLLAQDIAVLPMLALIPLLGTGHAPHGEHETLSLVGGLPGWGVALAIIGAIGVIIFGGHFLMRPLFRFIAQARLREMFTAATLLLVIGTAMLMSLVGLSPALGTFLAGVVLANSAFRHELESDIEPFKGLLLGLFFITVGAGIDVQMLFEDAVQILGLTFAMMLAKAFVLLPLARIFGLRGRDQWLFTLGLAQAGEFGFVLLAFSVQTGVLDVELSSRLLLVVALSMLFTPASFILYDALSKRHKEGPETLEPDEFNEQNPIIIAGVGRFGQVVNRMVGMNGMRTTVLDHNIETIEAQRKFGMKGFYGDPTRPEMMKAAGLMQAEILVVAVDDYEAAITLTRHARNMRPDIHIIARAHDRQHVYRLYRAGADQIVRETFDSSIRAAKYVLKKSGLPAYDIEQSAADFYDLDRDVLKELAQSWDPDIPISENEAFIEKARAFNAQLETALAREDVENDEQDDPKEA